MLYIYNLHLPVSLLQGTKQQRLNTSNGYTTSKKTVNGIKIL